MTPSADARQDRPARMPVIARTFVRAAVVVLALVGGALQTPAQVTQDAPAGRPAAIVDLATEEGVRLVKGQWRYSDVRIVEVEHRGPGPDLRPSGPPNRTYDITPHAGGFDFDDSGWEVLPAARPQARKGNGRLSFNWYRIATSSTDRTARSTSPTRRSGCRRPSTIRARSCRSAGSSA